VAAPSKVCDYGRSVAGIVASNPAGGIDVFVSVMCRQVEVSVTGRSLVQRSPTECDRGTSQRRPRPTRVVEPCEKKNYI
jgi:hypothetical protein